MYRMSDKDILKRNVYVLIFGALFILAASFCLCSYPRLNIMS